MAKIARQLYYKKSGVSYPISLYDSTANVGANYLTLRVTSAQGDAMIAYAQIAAVGTPGNSSLRVRKGGSVYAVNSSAQDGTLITSGGGVVDNGSCFNPPSSLTTGTYAGSGDSNSPVACTWTTNLAWNAINSMTCMFTVSYQSHISGVGVDHYRLRYGLTTACSSDGGVFSGTSRATPELATGTYYFRVDAEDASNVVLYSSAVYGGVANAQTTANSTGNLWAFRAHSAGYSANSKVDFTGSGTWVVPAGVTTIIVHGIGGGGGGGGKACCYRPTAGGGGGSGYFSYDNVVAVTPGETLTITIGAGGAAGTDSWTGYQPDQYSGRGGNGTASSLKRGSTVLLEWLGGKGSCWNVTDGTGTHGANSGQDHSTPGLGAQGGVAGETGGSSNVRYSQSASVVLGGRGGVCTGFGLYGSGGKGATGVTFLGSSFLRDGSTSATPGVSGKISLEYQNYSADAKAITATSGTDNISPSPTRRYYQFLTYTTQGYGTKYKNSGIVCADTCSCNCNYCTCNCNYCTCNCNYCTCNCNYSSCSCSSGTN